MSWPQEHYRQGLQQSTKIATSNLGTEHIGQLEIISSLCTYNRWANQRILDTAENLTTEQLLIEAGRVFHRCGIRS